MKNKKLHKYLVWLLVFAVVFSLGSPGNLAEAIAKSKSTAVKQISLEIGNKKVTKKTYQMKQGSKRKIKAIVSPEKGKKNIKFSSGNKKVATVNKSGMVTARKTGTARITVTASAKKTGKSKGYTEKKTWVKIKVVNPSSGNEDETGTTAVPAPTQPQVVQTPSPAETPDAVQTPAEMVSPSPAPAGNSKSIVMYFSCTNNTKTISEYVAEITDADIYRIEPAVPYTAEDLDYNNTDSRATKEQNNPSARPAIAGELPSLDGYENVYLGYPVWWGQAPKIMYTLVENCNLSGKTVIPFCTSASSGTGTSATNLQASGSSQAVWLDGRRFSGSSSKTDVENWIAGLGL